MRERSLACITLHGSGPVHGCAAARTRGGSRHVHYELDRCRPTFAIELLERIKHLFDVSGIVFVLSIHQGELEHSIKAVYGSGFDARRYLGRFIDLKYSLPTPDLDGFVLVEVERASWPRDVFQSGLPVEDFARGLAQMAHDMDLSLREAQQCIAEIAVLLRVAPPLIRRSHACTICFLSMLRTHDHQRFGQWVRQEVPMEDFVSGVLGQDLLLSYFGILVRAGLLLSQEDRTEEIALRTRADSARDAIPGGSIELAMMTHDQFQAAQSIMSLDKFEVAQAAGQLIKRMETANRDAPRLIRELLDFSGDLSFETGGD